METNDQRQAYLSLEDYDIKYGAKYESYGLHIKKVSIVNFLFDLY